MCGFIVTISKTGKSLSHELDFALDQIQHRGPDDRITVEYEVSESFIGIGFQRLSITDPTPRSMQPIVSKDRFLTLIFNGEIYNFRDLRTELCRLGHSFETSGDGEVLLAAYEQWGDGFLEKLDGMFSIIILDKKKNSVFVARDIYGEKPLFYARLNNGGLVFASEAKAIIALSDYKFSINHHLIKNSVLGYINYDSEETIFNGISNYPKGHYSNYSLDRRQLKMNKFYSFDYGVLNNYPTDQDARRHLYRLLNDAVAKTHADDVNGIISLSGGVDSSILAAVHAAQFGGKNTDTISVTTSGYPDIDESSHISLVNQHLALNSVRIDISQCPEQLAESCITELPLMHYHHENIIPGISMMLEWELYRHASQRGYKVVYDGQGADEIFGGYTTYFKSLQLDKLSNNYLRDYPIKLQRYLRQRRINALNVAYEGINNRHSTDDIIDINNISYEIDNFYSRYSTYFPNEKDKICSFLKADLKLNLEKTSLPSNLVCGDRSAMAFGIEVRHPFLTREVVEFGLALKDRHYFSFGYGKFLLRETFSNYLPDAVIWRADKVGYAGPQIAVMQSELMKSCFESSISKSKLNQLIEVKEISLIDGDFLSYSASELLNTSRKDWLQKPSLSRTALNSHACKKTLKSSKNLDEKNEKIDNAIEQVSLQIEQAFKLFEDLNVNIEELKKYFEKENSETLTHIEFPNECFEILAELRRRASNVSISYADPIEDCKVTPKSNEVLQKIYETVPKVMPIKNSSEKNNLWIISYTPVHKEPRVLRQIAWAQENGYRVFLFGYGDKELTPKHCHFIKLDLDYDHYQEPTNFVNARITSRISRIRMIKLVKRVASVGTAISLRSKKLVYLLAQKYVGRLPSNALRKYFSVMLFQQIPTYVANEKKIMDFFELNPNYSPDQIFVHDYFTMKPGVELKKRSQAKLSIDCHEYAAGQYSHIPSWDKNTRPQIMALLDKYLPQADTVTSVCDGISNLLTLEHSLKKPVVTIRSMPFKNIQKFNSTGDTIKILYHGEIYETRGLHLAVRALADCKSHFSLTLRGYSDPEYVAKLKAIAKDYGVTDRLTIEAPVPFNEIIPAANKYDIGYFVHEDTSPQRRFTLPNKFFEYTMAGLALCVSDLPEMSALVKKFDLGLLVEKYDPSDIAQALNSMTRADIDRWKKNALVAAEELNWEQEAQRFGDLIG